MSLNASTSTAAGSAAAATDRIAAVIDRLRETCPGRLRAQHVQPAQEASFQGVPLPAPIDRALTAQGIDELYAHQAGAVEAVRDGQHVVLATPTASGKTITYAVPALERALEGDGRTLYLAPQRALINDQERTLRELAQACASNVDLAVGQYTGQLSQAEKRAVRDREPHVLLATPDMLNASLLPFARRLWAWFFQDLEYVVVDEIHQYRGIFGSHVGLVLRRLHRLCEAFGTAPQFICCSATIGNPVEHAATVTGQPAASFDLVDEDASATSRTHWLFWEPPTYATDGAHPAGEQRSHHVETTHLFAELVAQDIQTLAFTRSRQTAERYAQLSSAFLRDRDQAALADRVAAYQGTLQADRRQEIEAGLTDGSIPGAWSTSALELGVDIGGLDAVLLDGYPGTHMETFQRAGRAGRDNQPSLVALVAGEDPLDQTVLHHPASLLEASPEQAMLNPANPLLLRQHLPLAAAERPLTVDDASRFGEPFEEAVTDLTDEAEPHLERDLGRTGVEWRAGEAARPQHALSLRSIDDRQLTLYDRAADTTLGDLPFSAGLRDAHPGAIYHHQGDAYEVRSLDLEQDRAVLAPTETSDYTQVLFDTSVSIDEVLATKAFGGTESASAQFAAVTVHEQVTGYQRRIAQTGDLRAQEELSLPATTLDTRALVLPIPEDCTASLRTHDDEWPVLGALHAIEHVLRGVLPLEVLCDRRDVRGVSTPAHPDTGRSTVLLYDVRAGGVGLARGGYERLETLFDRAQRRLTTCPCRAGCPACLHLPNCRLGNEPLEKDLAADVLAQLTSA